MRVLYFGTSCFAIPSLNAIINSKYDLIGVVSQPDKQTGRGMRLCVTPIKEQAQQLGLTIFTPEKARSNDFIEQVKQLKPDILIVTAYGQILPQALLDIPPLGGLNIHGSLLPKYRGAAPIQRSILNGETVTGVTIMQMDKGMDTGDIRLIKEMPILTDDNYGALEPKLAELGAAAILEALEQLEQGKLPREPQDNSLATYAPMIEKSEGEIQWDETAEQCLNRIRAFTPKPGSFTFFGNRCVRIIRAELADGEGKAGEILQSKGTLIIACGSGTLRLVEVQPECKGKMSGESFANGCRLSTGMLFGK